MSLISNELIVNILENSHDDKQLYIKYKSLTKESVWFDSSIPFNGRSIYAPRNNGDGIRYETKNQNQFFVKSPIGDTIEIYIVIKIPTTNTNSKFKSITLSN